MSKKTKKAARKKALTKAKVAKQQLDHIEEQLPSAPQAAAEVAIAEPSVAAVPVVAPVEAVREHVTGREILLRRILLGVIYGMAAVAVVIAWPHATPKPDSAQLVAVHSDYDALIARVEKLQTQQINLKRTVIDDGILEKSFEQIQTNTLAGKFAAARKAIKAMNSTVGGWETAIAKRPVVRTIAAGPTGENHTFAPILLYHHPPADLEQQFQFLVEHGYSSVTLKQVADAMNGGPGLPAKPVVITFDDGFADQMSALPLLQKYNLTAVFYIIVGGPENGYHIGANRHVPDPQGGDDYLTWDQIRGLDQSGRIEIAAHSINHVQLSAKSEAEQRHEIFDSKALIEQEIGHAVTDFCYPYGAFNQTTIDLVRAAGYVTATTTLPGTDQSVANQFTLRRIRDTRVLP